MLTTFEKITLCIIDMTYGWWFLNLPLVFCSLIFCITRRMHISHFLTMCVCTFLSQGSLLLLLLLFLLFIPTEQKKTIYCIIQTLPLHL